MPAPYEFHIPKEQEPTPAQIVNDAIVAANSGEMPNFTSEGLLQRLNLVTVKNPTKRRSWSDSPMER